MQYTNVKSLFASCSKLIIPLLRVHIISTNFINYVCVFVPGNHLYNNWQCTKAVTQWLFLLTVSNVLHSQYNTSTTHQDSYNIWYSYPSHSTLILSSSSSVCLHSFYLSSPLKLPTVLKSLKIHFCSKNWQIWSLLPTNTSYHSRWKKCKFALCFLAIR